MTPEQAQQKDWPCIYWPHPSRDVCWTTGRVTSYGMVKSVDAAVVIFANDPDNTVVIPITSLEVPEGRIPNVIRDTLAGARTQWWAGRQDAEMERDGVIL